MLNAFFFLVIIITFCLIWLLREFCFNRLMLDYSRDRMFTARRRLFELAKNGDVAFDDDAYRSVELLINGLIRYTHKYTLLGYIYAVAADARAKQTDKDYVDFSQQLNLKISRLNPKAQTELNEVLREIHNSLILYVAVTSFTFMVIWGCIYIGKLFKPTQAKEEIDRQVFIMERDAYISAKCDVSVAAAAA